MRRLTMLALVVLLGAGLGACGDDDDDDDDDGATGSTTSTTDADDTTSSQTSAPDGTGSSSTSAPGDTTSTTECEPAQAEGDTVRVEMDDFEFDPVCVELRANQSLSLENDGDVQHNLTVDDGDPIDFDLEPGEESNFEAIGGALEPGIYEMYCRFHRSSGMTGVFSVVL